MHHRLVHVNISKSCMSFRLVIKRSIFHDGCPVEIPRPLTSVQFSRSHYVVGRQLSRHTSRCQFDHPDKLWTPGEINQNAFISIAFLLPVNWYRMINRNYISSVVLPQISCRLSASLFPLSPCQVGRLISNSWYGVELGVFIFEVNCTRFDWLREPHSMSGLETNAFKSSENFQT